MKWQRIENVLEDACREDSKCKVTTIGEFDQLILVGRDAVHHILIEDEIMDTLGQ